MWPTPPQKPQSPGAPRIKTFRSAGDAGDIIYQLPAVRILVGNGGKGVFYIEAANYTRVKMVPSAWRGLDKVLMAQDYIKEVLPWNPEIRADVTLNDFRALMQRSLRAGLGKDTHLSDWVAMSHNVPKTVKDTAWLTIEPNPVAKVVINRTGPGRPPQNVYHGNNFPWRRVLDTYRGDTVFIGTHQEHAVFQEVFGEVPYHHTPSLYEAAQVVSGCQIFVGSQSCPFSFAEAMKKTRVLEVWHQGPNVLSFEPNCHHGWDHTVKLPCLEP